MSCGASCGYGDADDSAAAKAAVKDSTKKDTTTYKTKDGRIVHGGGGIVPDTVVKQKIPEYLLRLLFLKDAFFSFANNEYSNSGPNALP